MCDGRHEVPAGKVKGMGGLIRRVGLNLVGVHRHLILAVLELSEPRDGLFAPFVRFHVHNVVPWLGSILSGNREYRYLQKSVQAFPPPEDFATLMREAGLTDIKIARMPFGVAHLYVGYASDTPSEQVSEQVSDTSEDNTAGDTAGDTALPSFIWPVTGSLK